MSKDIITGVYFLKKDNKVVYVGQSVDIHRRIIEHKRVKEFDSYDFVECDKNLLDSTENSFIMHYNPILNIRKALINTSPKIVKKYEKDNDNTIISISIEAQKRIKELAKREKYTIRTMFDILLENYENK